MINPSTSAEPVRRKIAFCQSRFNLRWTVSLRTGQPHAAPNEDILIKMEILLWPFHSFLR